MATDFTRNFSLLDVVVTAAALTDASLRFPLGNRNASDVMIINTSQRIVFARTGDENVVADPATAMPILPGEKGIYARGPQGGNSTHIAFVMDTGVGSIQFTTGQGI